MQAEFAQKGRIVWVNIGLWAGLVGGIILGATGPSPYQFETHYAYQCGPDGDHLGSPCPGGVSLANSSAPAPAPAPASAPSALMHVDEPPPYSGFFSFFPFTFSLSFACLPPPPLCDFERRQERSPPTSSIQIAEQGNQKGKQTKHSRCSTKTILLLLGGFLIITGIIVGTTVGVLFSRHTTIVVQSANTKEDWMDAMALRFNSLQKKTTSGVPIRVQIENTGSTLKPELNPTVWSPANRLWVEQAVASEEQGPLLQDLDKDCSSLTNIPLGIAMWRPLAERLGWPDTPIGWQEILLLSNYSSLSEVGLNWGEFRFGHGHPEVSF